MPHGDQPRILLVEDTVSLAAIYRSQVESAGFLVDIAATGADTRHMVAKQQYKAVLLDIGLPDVTGLELLRELNQQHSGTSIVVITANASIAMAVEAVREGAYDYLIKPVTKDRLVTTLRNALERCDLKEAAAARPDHVQANSFCGFIGASQQMQQIYSRIDALSQSKASVFITGESGTGKELCAEAVHRKSPRASGPFVALNCGAIPRDLMESEIFGHLKGSFTGAISDREGAARLADGGTLFLDEICEMDLSLQTKLLRFLQTGLIQRVGSTVPEEVDIRIICATNKLPLQEVRAGRFREDLYFRLHVLPLDLPPLRERGHDALDIARHFLKIFAGEEGKAFESFSPDAEELILSHSWPGNVRELQNAVRQAVVLNNGPVVTSDMLPAPAGAKIEVETSAGRGDEVMEAPLDISGLRDAQQLPLRFPYGLELWEIEKRAIEHTIKACDGSIPKAARVLGVSPSTIYRKREAWAENTAS